MTDVRTAVLLVDDDPHLLEGLVRLLRRRFEVVTAKGAAEAVQAFHESGLRFAVVVSDYSMPGINGVTFLREMRSLDPDVVRVLLTGQADLDAAVDAVNEGSVFRFLRKPCAPAVFLGALDAACAQHDLIVSERVLLERTLRGSIAALVDILSLSQPAAFGRASRVQRLVNEMTEGVDLPDRWAIDVAALLSQIGTIALPPALIEKQATAEGLSEEEAEAVGRVPQVAARIIGNIPRLELVRDILLSVGVPVSRGGPAGPSGLPVGARLLTLALDFDDLLSQEVPPDQAFRRMVARTGRYDRDLLDRLAKTHVEPSGAAIREIRLPEVEEGMVFVDDVRTTDGKLLISRGQEATEGLVTRIQNYWADLPIAGTICVTMPVRAAQRTTH